MVVFNSHVDYLAKISNKVKKMADGRKGMLVSVAIISIILGAGLGYGLTIVLHPWPTQDNSGKVLQTKYLALTSETYKNDDDLVKTGMKDTHQAITTKGQSYIIVYFSCTLGYNLDALFVGGIEFNISLEVDGIEVAHSRAAWYAASAIGNQQEGTEEVTLKWVSDTLTASTHVANVTWVSKWDAPGLNEIWSSTVAMNMTRTLTMQEISM